ncbi:MAG: hypothetical protein H7Y38_08285 [Armatimonadetes bacterium]|nr:hypothetical protein [Armatimonadota bacterium]
MCLRHPPARPVFRTAPVNPNRGLMYEMDADNGLLSLDYTGVKCGGVPIAGGKIAPGRG